MSDESKERIAAAVEKTLEEMNLPERIDGRAVQIVVFETEDECRFFFPRRALRWHQKFTRELAIAIRKRKGKVARLLLTSEDYARDLIEAGGKVDLEAERYRYALARYKLLP